MTSADEGGSPLCRQETIGPVDEDTEWMYDMSREAEGYIESPPGISKVEWQRHIVRKFRPHLSDNLLFVTVTLKPKLFKYQSLTQYELTKNEFTHLLQITTDKSVWVVELTKDGNVHYHFMALVHSKFHRFNMINKFKAKQIFGFIKVSNSVESEDSLNRVAQYLTKEIEVTQRVLHRPGYNPTVIELL